MMDCASNITVTRGTGAGSETIVFTERTPRDDRSVAAAAISGLLAALDSEGIRHGWPVEDARIRAELLLEDWGFDRSGAAQ